MKKNLNWKTNKYSSFPKEKLAGTFLHPSSLPYGEFGIGDIGFSARKFANNFEDWGLSLWQMLPINLTDGHNSPYSSPCSFAGNPLLISLRDLVKADLLKKESLVGCQSQNSKVPFGKVKENKLPLISLAATNLSKSKNHPWKTELDYTSPIGPSL